MIMALTLSPNRSLPLSQGMMPLYEVTANVGGLQVRVGEGLGEEGEEGEGEYGCG